MKKLFLIFLCGCSATANHWTMDSIATGNRSFDSTRLRYLSSQAHPPLLFEMVRMGDHIDAFLCLTRFRLPEENVKILFTADNQTFEDIVPVHEGRMKVRLSQDATQKLILALQDGKKVVILIDDFEETLDPAQFTASFSKFASTGNFFQNLFKGPL